MVSTAPNQPESERDRLRSECHQLVDAIAKKSYYMKLLAAAKHSLVSINGYKQRKPKSTQISPILLKKTVTSIENLMEQEDGSKSKNNVSPKK